jgi:hypothetical protein
MRETFTRAAGTVLVAAICAAMWATGCAGGRQPERDAPAEPPASDVDARQLREQELQMLDSYGWVDRDNGVARIPIDRAMQLMLERDAFDAGE